MYKILLPFAFFLMMHCKAGAQNTKDTISIQDSMATFKELMNFLDDADKATSYFNVSAGIGNRLFSERNNSLNAKQGNTNSIIFSPSVGYYHKTGLSLTATADLLNDKSKGFGATQYAISPGFKLQNNNSVDFGISYTHYFVKDFYSSYSSPIQNDLYASFTYTKSWLQPGLSVGYSTGKYKDVQRKDTLNRHIYDSTTNNLHTFTLSASVGHDFDWYNIFSKKDGLVFTPELLLNFGSAETRIAHNTNATLLFKLLSRTGKLPKLQATSFRPESIGFNLDANYVTGNFTIEPQIYFDYYLPKISTKKFTQVFAITFAYSF